jgi:hypothetical protein
MRRLAVILYSSFAILFLFAAGERAVADRKWETHRFVYEQSHLRVERSAKQEQRTVKKKQAGEHRINNVVQYINGLLKGEKKAKKARGPPPVSYTYTADLPLKIADFYPTQPFIPGIKTLRDGVLTDPHPFLGIGNYWPAKADYNKEDSVQITIEVFAGWEFKFKAFHTYWNSGPGGQGIQAANPTKIYKRYVSDHLWHLSGTFIDRSPSGWIDVPFADSLQVIDGIKVVGGRGIFGSPGQDGLGDLWGAEWHIEGYYKDVPRPLATKALTKFGETFGADAYWWDFTKNDSTGADGHGEKWEKVQSMADMGLKNIRLYFWQANGYIMADQNTWAWESTLNGWENDTVLSICKRRGMNPIMCIMGGSKENYESWPDNNDDQFNPNIGKARVIAYADRFNRKDPKVYGSSEARMAFFTSARYGNDASTPDALMGNPYQHDNPFLEDNQIRKGLNLITEVEYVNEPDNTFQNIQAAPNSLWDYFNGEDLAAMTSAVKDGHHHTLDIGFGAGVGVGLIGGVKLVLSGFARPSPDQLLGYRAWCIKNRGWIDSAAGIWDCPVDAINYHDYSKDETEQTGTITGAIGPEMSGVLEHAQWFQDMSRLYFNGIPWYVTEFGFDVNHYSRFSVQGFSGYDEHEVAGLFYLRTQLTYLAMGVNKMTAYQLFATDSNNGTQFSSMALMRMDLSHLPSDMRYIIYPAGCYMGQAKVYKDYVFDGLLSSGNKGGDVWCLKMRKPSTDTVAYWVWSVEDTVPAFKDRFNPCCGVQNVRTFDFVERTGTYDCH